jgi:AraC-like DNA-binding protein
MRHYHHPPAPAIAAYVHNILVIEDYRLAAPFLMPLYANGLPTLLFHSSKALLQNRPVSSLVLFGQTIAPETLTLNESFTLIAYFLKPHALFSLFGLEARELTDRPMDLYLHQPQAARLLEDQLLHAASTEAQLQLLDRYIHSLITGQKKEDPILAHAANTIVRCHAGVSLDKLHKELYVTPRTFQRMFERKIGVSPNLLKRISQFNAAFWHLNSGNYTLLTDIAHQHSYADQSHFIRSFKEFTGITPKQYGQYPAR